MEKPQPSVPVSPEARRLFFTGIVQRHWDEMRQLFNGRLTSKEKDSWRNVFEHCVLQLAAAEALADLLKLPEKQRRQLQTVAAIHDWKKRLEIKPGNFTDEDKNIAERGAADLLAVADPDASLMSATGPDFIRRALVSEPTDREYLQFLLDDYTMGNEIVPFPVRTAEAENRMSEETKRKLAAHVGVASYWDAERAVCDRAQWRVFAMLRGVGVEIYSPSDIPFLLQREIARRLQEKQKVLGQKTPVQGSFAAVT